MCLTRWRQGARLRAVSGPRGRRPAWRWARQAAAAALVGGAVLATAATVAFVAPPSAGAATILFAYPTGTTTASTTCPQTTALTHECPLTRALQLVNASTGGDTVELAAEPLQTEIRE